MTSNSTTMPEASVVLPVFNGAGTIVRAVRSILEQTLRDIKLIVVNDGSTDETVRDSHGCAVNPMTPIDRDWPRQLPSDDEAESDSEVAFRAVGVSHSGT